MTRPNTKQTEAPADLVELGRIVSAYGVRGWIKVQPHSANSEVLLEAGTWWLRAPVSVEFAGNLPPVFPVTVNECRPQGSAVVAELASVPDRDAAEALKGHTVWVPRSGFPPADDDEYYWVDLIGCELYGEHEGESILIGIVADVIDNGAHAVLRVARGLRQEDGTVQTVMNDKGKPVEVLVPFVAAHVHTVDLPNKRLDSNWPIEL